MRMKFDKKTKLRVGEIFLKKLSYIKQITIKMMRT
jgi:hypothetical protein